MRNRRTKLIGIGTLFAVGLFLAPALLLVRESEVPLERAYASALITLVTKIAAGDAKNPAPNDPTRLAAGRAAFTGSCSLCHGASGDGRGLLGGRANFPQAADLRAVTTRSRSDAELFWITKNGLSFTAMPGFGDVYKDEDIWSIVAYVRSLQRDEQRGLPVPQPTTAQLAFADRHGTAAQRGAAIWFAQGCERCHGPVGDGPADLDIRGRVDSEVVRTPQPGMPAYGQDRVTDSELDDLVAYMLTFTLPR